MADEGTANCIDILLAILLPPLGVFLKCGCKEKFWICLVLTLFGYIPGIIYAICAIARIDRRLKTCFKICACFAGVPQT